MDGLITRPECLSIISREFLSGEVAGDANREDEFAGIQSVIARFANIRNPVDGRAMAGRFQATRFCQSFVL